MTLNEFLDALRDAGPERCDWNVIFDGEPVLGVGDNGKGQIEITSASHPPSEP